MILFVERGMVNKLTIKYVNAYFNTNFNYVYPALLPRCWPLASGKSGWN